MSMSRIKVPNKSLSHELNNVLLLRVRRKRGERERNNFDFACVGRERER